MTIPMNVRGYADNVPFEMWWSGAGLPVGSGPTWPLVREALIDAIDTRIPIQGEGPIVVDLEDARSVLAWLTLAAPENIQIHRVEGAPLLSAIPEGATA